MGAVGFGITNKARKWVVVDQGPGAGTKGRIQSTVRPMT